MPLPPFIVKLRSQCAQAMARVLGLGWPIAVRVGRLRNEIYARSQAHGVIEAGVQFIGLTTIEGTGNVHIGTGTRLGRRTFLETQGDGVIRIGRHCTINDGATIVAHDSVTIGDYALIGEYSSIRDSNHGTELGEPMRWQAHVSAPVVVEDDAWVGRGACVLKGVTIGGGAIVGANAVVTRSVAAMDIVGGVPARVIGNRKARREQLSEAATPVV